MKPTFKMNLINFSLDHMQLPLNPGNGPFQPHVVWHLHGQTALHPFKREPDALTPSNNTNSDMYKQCGRGWSSFGRGQGEEDVCGTMVGAGGSSSGTKTQQSPLWDAQSIHHFTANSATFFHTPTKLAPPRE